MEGDLLSDLSLQSLSNIFNRVNKSVISAIDSSYDVAIVKSRFESLRQHWMIVLARYERELELELSSVFNEQWIENIQESFERTEILHHQYYNSLLSVNSSRENQLNIERNLCKQRESRNVETQLFDELKEILKKMVLEYDDTENNKNVIMGIYHEYKQQFQSLQNVHINYMCSLRSSTDNDDIVREGEDWLDDVICSSRKVTEDVRKIIYGGNGPNISSETKSELKLEKMRLPSFDGSIRDYPRFKSDFENYVLPKLNPKDTPFVLKNCFVGQAYNVIKNVEDDTEVIWQRINEKYGRPSQIVDEVLFDILKFPTLLDDDKDGFIKFVTVIEEAVVDLKRVKLESEIFNCNVVSEIEKRLPSIIRREWSYEVVTNSTGKDHKSKFECLLRFLKEQRGGLEYLTSKVRYRMGEKDVLNESPIQDQSVRCGHIAIVGTNESKRLYKCGIHNTDDHCLRDCKTFRFANSGERIQMVIESRACWNCLTPGHKAKHCFHPKNCSVKGCKMWHHQLLHEAHKAGKTFGRQE